MDVAAADVERAEIYAETEAAAEDERTERNEDDNDTAEEIARINAAAVVDVAEAQADAAVKIVEAEAAAAVEIAEAEVDATVVEADAGADADAVILDETGEDEDVLADDPEAQEAPVGIEVPPQVEDSADRPKHRAEPARRVSAFRARRAHR